MSHTPRDSKGSGLWPPSYTQSHSEPSCIASSPADVCSDSKRRQSYDSAGVSRSVAGAGELAGVHAGADHAGAGVTGYAGGPSYGDGLDAPELSKSVGKGAERYEVHADKPRAARHIVACSHMACVACVAGRAGMVWQVWRVWQVWALRLPLTTAPLVICHGSWLVDAAAVARCCAESLGTKAKHAAHATPASCRAIL